MTTRPRHLILVTVIAVTVAVLCELANAGNPALLRAAWGRRGAAVTPYSPSITNGMIAYFPLDGDATETMLGNNGTVQGSATFTTGVKGQALSLSGSGQYVSIPTNTAYALSNSDFSVSLWVKPNTVAAGTMGLFYERKSTADSCVLGVELNRQAGKISLNTGESIRGYSTSTLTTNAWHHIVVTRVFSVGSYGSDIYINGAKNGFTSGSGAAIQYAWSIGRPGAYNGQYYNGAIDCVRLFNRELSSNEVVTIYNTEKP